MGILTRFAFTVFCIAPLFLSSAQVEPLRQGPIHEAYALPVKGLALSPIQQEPPQPILEGIPRQRSDDAVWIQGYWAFSPEKNDFIWISGIWRRPPPGHNWNAGFWRSFDDGWVWIPGFWSASASDAWTFLPKMPPEPIEEDVQNAPGNDYFWMPGYWKFSDKSQDYEWIGGQWYPFDPAWVLVPAHYTWRPEGYLFIPAYWDWPLEERGDLYAPVMIPADMRYSLNYTPYMIIEVPVILEYMTLYYPNYLCHLYHHFHYHPDFWITFPGTPAWWWWDSWWCFSWHNHWGLWWWYCHPGYPAPFWMNAHLSGMLPAPNQFLLNMIGNIVPPLNVTPLGVISTNRLLKGLSHTKNPVIRLTPQNRDRLKDIVRDRGKLSDRERLRPSGDITRIDPDRVRQVPKPTIPGDKRPIPRYPDRVRPPSVPIIPKDIPGFSPRPPVERPWDRIPETRPPRFPEGQPRPRPRPPHRFPEARPRPRPPFQVPETHPRPRPRPPHRVPDWRLPQPPNRRPDFQTPGRPFYPPIDRPRPDQNIPEYRPNKPPQRRPFYPPNRMPNQTPNYEPDHSSEIPQTRNPGKWNLHPQIHQRPQRIREQPMRQLFPQIDQRGGRGRHQQRNQNEVPRTMMPY